MTTTSTAGVQTAHGSIAFGGGRLVPVLDRIAREEIEDRTLAPGATRATGAGRRALREEPDATRTCFERDLDRIHHSAPFRRLAGKCQVFIAPEDDHLRTRLTHAIEVAQVAVGIARPTGLNVSLTAAAAFGHDCGHGPAGHASEDAMHPFVAGVGEGAPAEARRHHHAVHGADVVLQPLNLCVETLDAIRNHSWNRPAPMTPEGEVVAWADRIAYVCHDFEDAVRAGIVRPSDLPDAVAEVVGTRRSRQLHGFITAMVEPMWETGVVCMRDAEAAALQAFRDFNFERIYLRPESVVQAERVVELLRSLVEWFSENPVDPGVQPGTDEAITAAVRHVIGMTDRYALNLAVELLGWDPAALPKGV